MFNAMISAEIKMILCYVHNFKSQQRFTWASKSEQSPPECLYIVALSLSQTF